MSEVISCELYCVHIMSCVTDCCYYVQQILLRMLKKNAVSTEWSEVSRYRGQLKVLKFLASGRYIMFSDA